MVALPRIRFTALDVSSRTGAVLGAFANGLSFQPNLVSRDSGDQALISGVAAASAFGWASASHSLLRSVANRLPGARQTAAGRLVSGASVDLLAAAAGIAVARSLPARDGEAAARAAGRLTATLTAATGCAGLVADLLEIRRGRVGNRVSTGAVTAGTWALGYALSRRGVSGTVAVAREAGRVGAVQASGDDAPGPQVAEPVAPRQVDVPRAAAAGLAVTAGLLGFAWAESRLSGLAATAAATALGGESDDHRTLGRAAIWASLAAGGWWGLTRVNASLTAAARGVEPAHAAPPRRSGLTSGPGSHVPWGAQSREGRRFLTTALSREAIRDVVGEPATHPIRLYAPLGAATSVEHRARLLLAEIDRTEALRRPVFVLFGPTGSGYVNPVAVETLELLTRGACASAAIQYSVLPSALSLTRVGMGATQMRIVFNGIVERLLAMPAAERPRFYVIGESLGSDVSQQPFDGQGIGAVDGIGLDAAVWLGTPATSRWREELWGGRSLARPPLVGPDAAYLPRSVGDWTALSREQRERVQFLFLDNGNDPVPKMDVPLLWRRPPWLGPDGERPPGAPRRTWWLPVVTFFTTFVDLQNALSVTPGVFTLGGHDYRQVIPEALRETLDLPADDAQMAAVEAALRRRELAWEVRRRWLAAAAQPGERRDAALDDVVAQVGRWTGEPATRGSVRDLAHSVS